MSKDRRSRSSSPTSLFLSDLLNHHGAIHARIVGDNAKSRSAFRPAASLQQNQQESRWSSIVHETRRSRLLRTDSDSRSLVRWERITSEVGRHVDRQSHLVGELESEDHNNNSSNLSYSESSDMEASSSSILSGQAVNQVYGRSPARAVTPARLHPTREGPMKVPTRRKSIDEDDIIRKEAMEASSSDDDDIPLYSASKPIRITTSPTPSNDPITTVNDPKDYFQSSRRFLAPKNVESFTDAHRSSSMNSSGFQRAEPWLTSSRIIASQVNRILSHVDKSDHSDYSSSASSRTHFAPPVRRKSSTEADSQSNDGGEKRKSMFTLPKLGREAIVM
jgi:hypothetical protein